MVSLIKLPQCNFMRRKICLFQSGEEKIYHKTLSIPQHPAVRISAAFTLVLLPNYLYVKNHPNRKRNWGGDFLLFSL